MSQPSSTSSNTDPQPERDRAPHHHDHATVDRPMSPADIEAAYDDNAGAFARFDRLDRLLVGRYRRRQFGDATGRVLDVACGTGTNFQYLPASTDLVGVDLSRGMLAHARDALDDLDRDGDLHRMDAQDLAFPDDSFDTVVSALSTCTFPDPVAALDEMARVCKPDGSVRLLEHGESAVGPVARFQRWRSDAHYESFGCRWTQRPIEHVEAADLAVESSDRHLLGIVTTVDATPE
jgi:ubiquinone/menaquinone biosynthesis C-methylase UbiE